MLFRVNYIARRGTLDIVNTLHFLTKDETWLVGDGSDDPGEVLDHVDTGVTDKMTPLYDTSTVLDRITCVQVANPHVPSQVPTGAEKTKNVAGTRTLADENLPHELCGLLALKSDVSGRFARGRMFVAPVEATNALSVEGFLDTSNYWVRMQDLATRLEGLKLHTSPWQLEFWDEWSAKLVIYSRTRHLQNITPFTFPVTKVVPRNHPSFLRSRRK